MDRKTDAGAERAFDAMRFYLFEQVDVGDALRAAVSQLHAHAQRHAVEVEVIQTADFTRHAHRSAFMVLLKALLENAIQFSPRHGKVTVTASPQGLSVRDNGPGMSADELARVGRWFWRGAAGQASFRAGIGLAVAGATVARHGWTLHAANLRPGMLFVVSWRRLSR
ncbi:hypothetical protein J8I26_08490 [Herbaspirillum sp. LeCh32-8]|uniref:sensor histidine kinase n=1 Tax=Herbaspirillum sp. LeCh32-8 TaxID=2821356 RepID=UPI001AE28910|nr:ATP-binding protein [Herbaspirillum sp. LeCh32-8]MBP0598136.1 hypothetical protein [Herbaspirillum sp. LeCh32-8]